MNLSNTVILLVFVLSFISCSGTKGLKDTDQLFVGTEVKFKDKENISDRNNLTRDIKLSFLKKNTPGLLNIKTGFYNLFDSTGTEGFKYGVKYKMGSAPVVFENSMIRKTKRRLENLLIGSGYLNSNTKCDTVRKKRKVRIECDVTLNKRYTIDSVFYPSDTLPMTKVLKDMYSIDYLKSGEYIQRKNIIHDRDEFIKAAHNNGYPFVSENDVIFVIDTTIGNHQVDVHMQIRPTTDSTKYERYRYGNIYINPNFSLEEDQPMDTTNMVQFEKYFMTEGYDFLNEKSLNKTMYIKEGIIYNSSRTRITSNRLIDYGLFKFVNVKTRRNSDNTLDHFFNLTTFKMESITGELELNNRQGNFLGMVGKGTYVNKNLFGGAERFETSISLGLETQFGDNIGFINTGDITVESSLTLPYILLPFTPFKTNKNYIPKTFISLSANQQRRVEFYTVRSANAKYGFKWNETENKSSFWVPIDLQWLVLLNTTPEFDSLLVSDRRLQLSFRNTLVLGSSYEYLYHKKNKYNPINQLYFRGTIESAGSLLYLYFKLKNNNQQGDVAGTPYAQYLRLTADVRKYWALDVGSIATRFVAGTGFAFGNSNEVPYSKQYSIGGANDIRAFRLRSIGPGSFISSNPDDGTTQFIDQTGDIKLEFNAEYRFPIIGYFKGAFFLDAGNVWQYSSFNPKRVFKFDKFYQEIAVGTGFGLRLDFDYFVLRGDIAFPLRDINNFQSFDWVVDEINFLNRSWRSENLVYNLAIGYPF